jgi:hypothetical protein
MSETHSTHQENVKLHVRQIFLDEMIRTITETVPGCAFRVVFNLNQLGIAELLLHAIHCDVTKLQELGESSKQARIRLDEHFIM